MISLNFLVLFTVIGCILSVQPKPNYVISFDEIPCNFTWANDIEKIHPKCNIDTIGYVSPDLYLCVGLLKKSHDLCLLYKHNNRDLLNKKPNVDSYDSNICNRFQDFFINSSDVNWIAFYNTLFSSNSSCHEICVDLRQKVNPLCQYTLWVTDEFNKIRNNEAHALTPTQFNVISGSKTNSRYNNTKINASLSEKIPSSQFMKAEKHLNEIAVNKTELHKYVEKTANEDATKIVVSINSSVLKSTSPKTESNSISETHSKTVSTLAQTSSKITKSSIPTTFEGSTNQDHTVDIQAVQSSSIISGKHVTDKETIYASTTVQTTTKENNPNDSVLEKSEIVDNVAQKISTSKTVYSDNVDEATGNEIDNTAEFTNQDDEDDEPEVKEPSADGPAGGSINEIETSGPAPGKIEIDSISTVDQFMKPDESHFFAYFMTMMVLCIIGYLVFHNKQKILALALEGRSRRSRRRPSTSGYRKLDSNLEEAITSSRSSSATNVIY